MEICYWSIPFDNYFCDIWYFCIFLYRLLFQTFIRNKDDFKSDQDISPLYKLNSKSINVKDNQPNYFFSYLTPNPNFIHPSNRIGYYHLYPKYIKK